MFFEPAGSSVSVYGLTGEVVKEDVFTSDLIWRKVIRSVREFWNGSMDVVDHGCVSWSLRKRLLEI